MALWTDPSRQCLITSIRNRPVIWDKNYVGESNYRTLKNSAFRDVTDEMNQMFIMSVKFTCEDVRSQWKNLKDTFVRKLRWVHEGKYMEDAMKEPTWKFYRMLTFLDEKEAKRLGDTVEHTYELAPATNGSPAGTTNGASSGAPSGPLQNCHSLKQERQSMLQSTSSMMTINYEPTSPEEQMLQMFNQPPVLGPQSQQHRMIEQQIPTCSSTETICAKPAPYSPRSQNGSSSGVEEDEEEPRRKRQFRRHPTQMQVIHSPMSMGQDEFDHFGALVAANLRRMCAEQGRQSATRVQRKLSDVLFSED